MTGHSAEPRAAFLIYGPAVVPAVAAWNPYTGISLVLAFLCAVSGTGLCLAFLSPNEQLVALPSLALATIAILFILALTEINAAAPLSEIGVYYIAAIALYGVLPLVGYLLRGMTFTPYNDLRLYYYRPTPAEMGAQGWRYVAYMLPCATAYLWIRGRFFSPPLPLKAPDRSVLKVAVITALAMQLCLFVYSLFYGVKADTYAEKTLATAAMAPNVPYWLLQIFSHMAVAGLTLKMLVIVLLFREYRKYRLAIWIWLGVETGLTITQLGARSPLVFLLISAGFMYHRMVKPVRFFVALLVAVVALCGYQLFGFIRAYGSAQLHTANFVTGVGEFESHFATGYDIVRRHRLGSLPPVPAQVYFSDFLALIPSQLLPYTKWTGAAWYLEILGVRRTGMGLVFGAIAESEIGFGWPELVVRGLVLGIVFGLMNRWYMRRGTNFWITVLYLYLVVNCYHSFRASSFYWLGTLWLQVAPVYLLIWVFTRQNRSGAPDPA